MRKGIAGHMRFYPVYPVILSKYFKTAWAEPILRGGGFDFLSEAHGDFTLGHISGVNSAVQHGVGRPRPLPVVIPTLG